jgi:FkbM family methyltransferase
VVFIEPSTFSVESILKTVYVQSSRGVSDRSKFEIVHAGCGDEDTYGRCYYHEIPKPGATRVSFSDLDGYDRGGRSNLPVYGTQWIKGVSLDSLVYKYGFPSPTHVKIDIDGFENKALRGARRLLEEGGIVSWAIEVNGEQNVMEIGETMTQAGYREVAREQHHPGFPPLTFDFIYERK